MKGSVYADRGWFWCEFKRHPKLGRVRERFGTSKEAEALRAHIAAYGAFPEGFGGPGGPNLAHSWNAAHDALKAAGGPDQAWRSKGQDASQARIHKFIRTQPLGATPVEKITYDVLEAFATKLGKPKTNGKSMAPRTISKYLVAVTVVMTYAARKGWIDRLPVVPKIAAQPHHQPIYSEIMLEGVCNALATLGEPVAAFLCRVLYHSALRVGELLSLRPENVDDEFIMLLDPNKVKNEECRAVHIGADMARDLRAIVAAGAMPKYRRLHHLVTKANEMCGYEMVRPLHAFRHTAASSVTGDDTINLEDAQDLLGHKDPKTTLGYRKKSMEFLRARAKKLSQKRGKLEISRPNLRVISSAD